MSAKTKASADQISVTYVPISDLKPAVYNPRRWDKATLDQVVESITRFGVVDPIIVNKAPGRRNIIIGGHLRLEATKRAGLTHIPVVYVNIPDITREKELNLRLNKNQGEFDLGLLAEFDEQLLADVGFSSEEIDAVFDIDVDTPEEFDLQKELAKLDIKKVVLKKGDVLDLAGSRLMIGDSTIEADMLKLMDGELGDMCFTDPPYILDYLRGKRKGNPTTGFGAKRNRRYLETDILPPDFTEKWMANIAKRVFNNPVSL